MEENFKNVIEDIKKSTIDPKETKRYILIIKRVFRKAFENCENEFSESQILQMCLEEYKKDLEFRGNSERIFNDMLVYTAYKKLLNLYKSNKAKFDQILKEAKKREQEEVRKPLTANIDSKESMVSALRHVLRVFNPKNEKGLIESIKTEKNGVSKVIKSEMIKTIQACVGTLEEYGFIDQYIKESNQELEQLGLSEAEFLKRNPVADEYYAENGEIIKVVENIGVLDVFSTDNLNSITLEDLELMTAFYESKYLEERFGLSKAMSVIKTLDLWDEIFYEDDKAILELDNEKVTNALKKDLAITYLCKNGVKVTSKIKRQYKKFIKENDMNSDIELEEEITEAIPEIANLSNATKDIGVLECLIIYHLKEKDMKVKKWGEVKDSENLIDVPEIEDLTTIAIENQNFRGQLLMGLPKRILKTFLESEQLDLPEYKGKIDSTYSRIMSRLYVPTNVFFFEKVKKAYEENSESEFLANLVGKKVKKVEDER